MPPPLLVDIYALGRNHFRPTELNEFTKELLSIDEDLNNEPQWAGTPAARTFLNGIWQYLRNLKARVHSADGWVTRDQGLCAACRADTTASSSGKRARGTGHLWQADHIVPVVEGGGEFGIENYRTLCTGCHRKVTAELLARLSWMNPPKGLRD